MKRARFPILEFDPARTAVIEPAHLTRNSKMPERCVLCFFHDVIAKLRRQRKLRHETDLKSESGKHPAYVLRHRGRRIGVFHPRVGAPLAAASLEGMIARGTRKLIACGACGVLDNGIAAGHLIVPTAALRDEGSSYQYLPPARWVKPTAIAVAAVESALKESGCAYILGKTWTTDGFYRETPAKVRARRAEGCICVEMEAAAFFAVARFRRVAVAQILYGGDDVSSETWNPRGWDARASVREKLFWLAAEACVRL